MLALVLAACFLCLFLVLAVFGFRAALRGIFPPGTTATVRIAAAGLTLVLWSGTVRNAFWVLYLFCRECIGFCVAEAAEINKRFANGASAKMAISSVLPDVERNILGFLRLLETFPLFSLLLALITLVLLVRILAVLSTGRFPEWLRPLQNLDRVAWQNTLVLVVFFAGIYLSVASLCTIPALEVNQPFTETERAQINAQIDAYTPTADAFTKQFPEAVQDPTDELASLRSLVYAATNEKIVPPCSAQDAAGPRTQGAVLSGTESASSSKAETANVATTTGPVPTDSRIAYLHRTPEDLQKIIDIIKLYDADSCRRRSLYANMRATVQDTERSEAEKAKNQINSNFALRLTGRDRADYTYTLEANYQAAVNQVQAALAQCRSTVQNGNPLIATYAEYMASYLRTVAANSDSKSVTTFSYPEISGMPLTSYSDTACDLPALSLQNRSAAPAPQLGIFSFFFGWLANSDSLALSIICGMLGVGLVGCIVSTFVRQQVRRGDDDPWIANAFPVIVRGFTAAIVVYLAIEGGLNIFSASSNQANPYVLLFACLVGAVFSEDVWVVAHKRLQSADTNPRTGQDGPEENGTEENKDKPNGPAAHENP